MADASQFPITEGYGWQQGYPLHTDPNDPAVPSTEKTKYPGNGYGFHTGIDWGCPIGTPIVVNGMIIGLSGNTGEVFGPHVHVGRFVNGVCTNPGSPWKFTSAVVTEVNEDPIDGKYVRVQADGASYVYLHMSDNSKVKVNQTLQGGNVDDIQAIVIKDRAFATRIYQGWLVENPGSNADTDNLIGKTIGAALDFLDNSARRAEVNKLVKSPSGTPTVLVDGITYVPK